MLTNDKISKSTHKNLTKFGRIPVNTCIIPLYIKETKNKSCIKEFVTLSREIAFSHHTLPTTLKAEVWKKLT